MAEVLKEATKKGAHGSDAELSAKVASILADIEKRGEAAVRELSATFDNWEPESFQLTESQIEEIVAGVDPRTVDDIKFAQTQIRNFAEAPAGFDEAEWRVETMPGVALGHKNIPVAERWAPTCPGGGTPWWLRPT